MGFLSEDMVTIRESDRERDPTVITINCPDKTGLGCDLGRILLFFGLNIVRGDVSTDGKWCYLVFWVVGKPTGGWNLLKSRLSGACPSYSYVSPIYCYRDEPQPPKPPDVFLLTLCCSDRKGLLYDVTVVLSRLELVIEKVKVSTTPDGSVMDLFFITDIRELLHTAERQEDTFDCLKEVIGNALISYAMELMRSDMATPWQACSLLPSATMDAIFPMEMPEGSSCTGNVSINIDNTLSPAHSLVQIICQDHKGLLYDIMRTFKDYSIQISYGRFTIKQRRNCEIDLFIMQSDGRKILDPNKQSALTSRLYMELKYPLRVAVVNRGPDTELLVANPVELSGRGRPLVFHDITHTLWELDTCIFSAEIGRHMIGDREWEVYRVLIDEGGLMIPKGKIENEVWKMLMGWQERPTADNLSIFRL